MTPALTPAQRRALMALTGEWVRGPMPSHRTLLRLRKLQDAGLIQSAVRNDEELALRLTPAGLELKEKLK